MGTETDIPLISVIVPVYGVERYLDRCVESVVNQTYRHLEIILVDDGSPDACPAMCDAWAQRDTRIRVAHKANGGLSSARNAGLDVATGELVGFVDSDDWIDSTMYETMAAWMRRHEDADVVMCGTMREYEDGRHEPFDAHYPERSFTSQQAVHDFLYHRNRMASASWNKLYDARFFRGNDAVRFPEGLNNEDYYMLAQVYPRMRGLYFNPASLYHYSLRPGSITTAKFNEHSLDRAKIADACCSLLQETGYQDDHALAYFAMQGRYDVLHDLVRMRVDRSVIRDCRKDLARAARPVYANPALGCGRKAKIFTMAHMPRLYVALSERGK
ncbi:glycosyltransferase [Bifidobacterium pullorum subsp. saeculare]|uniref:Glycosyltransferase n=1 Tax=Bifidobacterium pullorum subsp. saeculare TaxID=78257 RepID=A0A939B888_9BIFI|nr:glycosyltransferase [Bifidobacterium pullorum]MBM6699647.1 glycosyltransferase [Bifidobacterium pullorum subsp. saeculare]